MVRTDACRVGGGTYSPSVYSEMVLGETAQVLLCCRNGGSSSAFTLSVLLLRGVHDREQPHPNSSGLMLQFVIEYSSNKWKNHQVPNLLCCYTDRLHALFRCIHYSTLVWQLHLQHPLSNNWVTVSRTIAI